MWSRGQRRVQGGPSEVSEEWPREAAPIEAGVVGGTGHRGRGAQDEARLQHRLPAGAEPSWRKERANPTAWPRSGRPSQLAVINLYPSPPSPGR